MRREASLLYVGNEGIVVRTAEGTIAIDALFGGGAEGYADTSVDLRAAIENARPPFDAIDVILATHYHPDHFDPAAVEAHLRANTRTSFLSTEQSVDLLRRKAGQFPQFESRVRSVAAPEGVAAQVAFGGIDVTAFGTSHGKVNYADVQHLGFLVRAGGWSMVHLGDAIIHERALENAGVLDVEIDFGFLPFWYATYPVGRRLTTSRFRLKHVFALHLPLAERDHLAGEVAAGVPGARALCRSGDVVSFSGL